MNKRKEDIKYTINAMLSFLFSLMFALLVYLGFKEQDIDLNTCDKIESVIVDKGVGLRYDDRGRSSSCFYILLKDGSNALGVYRMSKNYDDLLTKFNIGDTVTAYYFDYKNKTENINIDLIQVSKKEQILLDKSEYEKKERVLIYLGLIGFIFMLRFSYLYYKKRIKL